MEKVWRGIGSSFNKIEICSRNVSNFEEELLKALDLEEDTLSIELL